MKVEILENKLSSDGYSAELGDRLTVSDEIGKQWCAAGWVKDLSGEVATSDRVVIKAVLEPANVIISAQAQGV